MSEATCLILEKELEIRTAIDELGVGITQDHLPHKDTCVPHHAEASM